MQIRTYEYLQKGTDKFPIIYQDLGRSMSGSNGSYLANVAGEVIIQRTNKLVANDAITNHLNQKFKVKNLQPLPNGFMKVVLLTA